jgi:DNA-binding PadR family transcriptional regulator
MEYPGARGLPTNYGVLGLLLDGSAHGYDLQRRLRAGFGPVWRVAWSQLYSVLRSLEQRGWIRGTTGSASDGPPRRTYILTAAGRAAFFSWAEAPVARLRDVRVEFLAKLYFLRRQRPEELGPALARQAEALRQALEERTRDQRGDPWVASIAASFRHRQTESALAWIEDVRRSLGDEGKDKR